MKVSKSNSSLRSPNNTLIRCRASVVFPWNACPLIRPYPLCYRRETRLANEHDRIILATPARLVLNFKMGYRNSAFNGLLEGNSIDGHGACSSLTHLRNLQFAWRQELTNSQFEWNGRQEHMYIWSDKMRPFVTNTNKWLAVRWTPRLLISNLIDSAKMADQAILWIDLSDAARSKLHARLVAFVARLVVTAICGT